MKLSIRPILETVLGLLLLVATVSVSAQTVGAGPYYATPSWDQTLPSNTRFIVLSNMNSEAVLDRETGLVWQRTPDQFFVPGGGATYEFNIVACTKARTGGRLGWRLPSVHELMTLFDPTLDSTQANIALPPGHPFTNVPVNSVGFWTATTSAVDSSIAYVVDPTLFPTPIGNTRCCGVAGEGKSTKHNFWCVRGGGPTSTE
jgi:hypothetical protein